MRVDELVGFLQIYKIALPDTWKSLEITFHGF